MIKLRTKLSLSESAAEAAFDQQQQISKIVDDHIGWLVDWQRLAMFGGATTAASADKKQLTHGRDLTAPKSFSHWFKGAAQRLNHEQSAIDRLGVLFDSLHKLAKSALLRADGKAIPPLDYELVMQRYADFMQALRTFERSFTSAAAGVDELTGLRSRFHLIADITAELNRSKRTNQPFALALFDLDDFKTINQLHGRETGDKAIIAVAEAITKTIRPYDDAYRAGGEEFIICFKGTSITQAAQAAQRVLGAIQQSSVRLFGGGNLTLSASHALLPATADMTASDVLNNLEHALVTAKETKQ